jgi:hypothetical protein
MGNLCYLFVYLFIYLFVYLKTRSCCVVQAGLKLMTCLHLPSAGFTDTPPCPALYFYCNWFYHSWFKY